MIIIFSGPDRVGKSTLAAQVAQISGFTLKHHSAPNLEHGHIFDVYRENLKEGGNQIWDRSYVCAYILERFRKRTHDHMADIVDLELEMGLATEVIHVGVDRPWCFSAPLHYEELREEGVTNKWVLRDLMMARQNEHQFYNDEMTSFLKYGTMFPAFMVDYEWDARRIWDNCRGLAIMERPKFPHS